MKNDIESMRIGLHQIIPKGSPLNDFAVLRNKYGSHIELSLWFSEKWCRKWIEDEGAYPRETWFGEEHCKFCICYTSVYNVAQEKHDLERNIVSFVSFTHLSTM